MVDPAYMLIMATAIAAGIFVARYTQVALPLSKREKPGLGSAHFAAR